MAGLWEELGLYKSGPALTGGHRTVLRDAICHSMYSWLEGPFHGCSRSHMSDREPQTEFLFHTCRVPGFPNPPNNLPSSEQDSS